ncbi:Protein kinase C [Hondaea fermentalgiana]|uniref:Protein kinase C n=1 Tax=Hondaea fermentalgiana TaxID=2315210 RepID=A0A2R5GDV9_9STRA|nr:Protein kinase C [Hondaea fermentalgiana]|eukprot:GBG25974.1 Protein kinase C [Hondaea fermentalgiana]
MPEEVSPMQTAITPPATPRTRGKSAQGSFVSSPELLLLGDDGDGEPASLLAHDLDVKTFTKPTKCAACGKLLLGVRKQGLACAKCGLATHRKCAAMLEAKSPCQPGVAGDLSGPKRNVRESPVQTWMLGPQDHALVVKTFSKPTTCKVCNELLLGLFKQGLECRACNQLGALDSTIEGAFAEANAKMQTRLEAIEREGVATSIANGLRAQTKRTATSIESLSQRTHSEKTNESVPLIVDPATLEAAEFMGNGALKVGNASARALGMVRDRVGEGMSQLSKTELARAFAEETDPDMRRALADVIAGLSLITNQVWDSVSEIGSAAGRSIVTAATDNYGPDAGRLAQASTNIVGGGYNTIMAGGGLISGSHIIQAPFRTADRWALREPVVFDGNMYQAVFDMLAIKKRSVRAIL